MEATSGDYLGEAGLGAWSYTGGMPFNRPYPWLLAGAGSFTTYYGRALAVVRVRETGAVHISISGEGLTGTQITL